MNIQQHRNDIQAAFNQWLAFWQQEGDSALLADNIELHSNQLGSHQGKTAVAHAYQQDREKGIRVYAKNQAIRGNGEQAAMSSYLYGNIGAATFNGKVIVYLRKSTHWQIEQIRVETYPDRLPIAHWKMQANQRGWFPGKKPAIVSELDSPWAHYPDHANQLEGDEASRLQELYAKYSWGVDLADWGIFKQVFTEDIVGDMPPIGDLPDYRSIVGWIRGLRDGWGEQWHCGTVFGIEFTDENTAHMQIGRTISERPFTDEGKDLYGAFYTVEAKKGSDGQWRYRRMRYDSKWFALIDNP